MSATRSGTYTAVLMLCTGQLFLASGNGNILHRTKRLSQEGCTIGVASAIATADGRPLLWKVRDNSDLPNNSVSFDRSYLHKFIAVTNSGGQEPWMGVNERGFAIINATSYDLPGGSAGMNNGLLMRHALGTCGLVKEFMRLLDSTNATGRRTQGTFGVIDSTGAAMMFEVGGSAYWTFDANNAMQSPDGYVIRTNFSMNGGGRTGIERYRRALAQIAEFRQGDSLDYRSILRYHARDFSDQYSNQVPVPYPHEWVPTSPLGYIASNLSISRYKSVSASVIVGIKFNESPSLSTMWTILGQPASGIAVPYWPVGDPPMVAAGSTISPLHEIATRIRSLLFDFPLNHDYVDSYKLRDDCGNGLWACTFPAEDSIFAATDALLGRWRQSLPQVKRMLGAENSFAGYAHSQLSSAYQRLMARTAFTVSNNVSYMDENGKTLENGDIVQLIWAGTDGSIDPPNMEVGSEGRGQPTGDDRLIGIPHQIGENTSTAGTFRCQTISWPVRATGSPAAGDLVYVRAFNSNQAMTATRYGDAQLHRVSMEAGHSYTPTIKGGRTAKPLERFVVSNAEPSGFIVPVNYPNPFNSSTFIEYELPHDGASRTPIEVIVFNSIGQEVRTLFSGALPGGRQRLEWDGKDNAGSLLPSGVFFLRLKTGSTAYVGRMMLLK